MIRTQGDIIDEFVVRGQINTASGFYTDAIIRDWGTQAVRYASGLHKWPFTEGRQSTTFASLITSEDGYLRGEYPEGWKPDSIRLLTIEGKRVDKKDFYQFRDFLEDNSSSTERIYSDFYRNYYINPQIDLSGTVTVWGQYTPVVDMTDTTATTPFSDHEEEGNDAIIEIMLSYAKTREKKSQDSLTHLQKAQQILEEIWKRILDEQYQYQTTKNDGMFERFDVLEGGFSDEIFKRDQF